MPGALVDHELEDRGGPDLHVPSAELDRDLTRRPSVAGGVVRVVDGDAVVGRDVDEPSLPECSPSMPQSTTKGSTTRSRDQSGWARPSLVASARSMVRS